jgi:hypothetical protein
VLAGLLLAYFAGTVLYVKTMIRDRGDVERYRLSVTYHVAVCVPAAIASPWFGALFAAFAVRAAVVPKRWPGLGGKDRRRRDRGEFDPRHDTVTRLKLVLTWSEVSGGQ